MSTLKNAYTRCRFTAISEDSDELLSRVMPLLQEYHPDRSLMESFLPLLQHDMPIEQSKLIQYGTSGEVSYESLKHLYAGLHNFELVTQYTSPLNFFRKLGQIGFDLTASYYEPYTGRTGYFQVTGACLSNSTTHRSFAISPNGNLTSEFLEDLEQINPFYPGWLSRIHSTTRI